MKTNVVDRMYHMSLALVSLCFLSLEADAQNRIGIIAQAGPTEVEVNGLGAFDVVSPFIKPIAQYTAGIQYERQLNAHWSLITGAQYTSRGFGIREQTDINLFGLDIPVGGSIETRLQYIEVPLAIQYELPSQGVAPFIEAGVSGAYALDGKIQPRVNAIISWKLPAIPLDLEDDIYNRLDVSAHAGVGLRIPTNDIGSFHIKAQYRHSVSDMFQDNITDIRIKSHGFSAGIGYTIRF